MRGSNSSQNSAECSEVIGRQRPAYLTVTRILPEKRVLRQGGCRGKGVLDECV